MSIDSQAYWQDSFFERELTDVFGRRMFVGTIADFPEIDSYKTIQLGSEPITVRNTPRGLRAYSNVCLHRNCLIDPPGMGRRPFRCPYHAWKYDAEGKISHTPGIDPACLGRNQLQAWEVETVDGFVFIGEPNGDTSVLATALRQLSIKFSTPFFTSHIDHECNWKLLVENVLEGYHLSSVHPTTFAPTGVTSNSRFRWGGDESVNWSVVEADPTPRTTKLASIVKGTRLQYGHVHVFPNLFVSNGNDHIGYIGHFIPVGPNRTRLEWCLFEQELLMAQNDSIRESLRNAAIEFTKATLAEDKAIVEACQIGLQSKAAGCQWLEAVEPRVMHFHSYYKRFISDV